MPPKSKRDGKPRRRRPNRNRADDEQRDAPRAAIWHVLRDLPLGDEPYLGMQALNLQITDAFLENQEAQLLAEYMHDERTPIQSTLFVSALSQMWVFALYEFLRTWRQRVKDVLQWAKEIQATPAPARDARLASKRAEIAARAAEPDGAAVFFAPAYDDAATDPTSIETLQNAIDRTERLFRRIEALRVSLAKHEIPRMRGSRAMAPGYGRIDMQTGSIYWMVSLGGKEVDLVSRQTLADECRRLALDREIVILPEALQEKVRKLPEHSYGVKRIAMVLDDGVRYPGLYVGWNKEVLTLARHEGPLPFDVGRVVEVQDDPLPLERDPLRATVSPGQSVKERPSTSRRSDNARHAFER